MAEPVFMADPVLWDPLKPMCHVVKAGDFIWLSGIVAYDDDRNLVGVGDIKAQSRQIFRTMERRLAMVGCTLRSVIRLTTYMAADMKDMTNVRLYWDVRQEFFGDHRPASTGFQVAALLLPEMLVEVDAVAYAPDAVVGASAQILPPA
jgi:enamine deaminase RidA (YjgF/YER057c/UK114 family)